MNEFFLIFEILNEKINQHLKAHLLADACELIPLIQNVIFCFPATVYKKYMFLPGDFFYH